MSQTKEVHFEDHIEHSLVSDGGWQVLDPSMVDPDTGVFVDELLTFVETTQSDQWSKLTGLYPSESAARTGLAKRVANELDNPSRNGVVDLLRNGVIDLGVQIELGYFRPAHTLTPELEALYQANRLGVVRQLDVGSWKKAGKQLIDMTLVVNGIPVATAELKNRQTGQNVSHAVKQYRRDRDPANPILRRCVVHFAVDADQVLMTTRLAGEGTRFLPFDRGNNGGRGNPSVEGKHRTFYLWEGAWSRDAWMDILGRFVHTETDPESGQVKTIFPRFQQWDAVRKLVAGTLVDGPGTNYLVAHSAGSGKSATIAWMAHRLANLHNAENEKVFDKVIVITDRIILDDQLSETIYQFDRVRGVVKHIDNVGGPKSSKLADALTDATSKIVICTLQTFGFVADKLHELGAEMADQNFAVLVDEAHSSQTGRSATQARAALTIDAPDEGEALDLAEVEQDVADEQAKDGQDELNSLVAGRGRQKNLSYYAFTATPKPRTRELFGTLVDIDGESRYAAFHTYTMRQAIEEGFILDVLENYTTYKTFWKIEKAVREDPEFDERKAKAAIARFVSLHPTNVAQKVEVIVEHFRQHVEHRIEGRAKAMVVTSSRLHAVRYKQAIDRYVKEKGYGIHALVAFSGKVIDGGGEYTESGMNSFPMSETARRFDTDEYQVLVVAEKFQTGFSQSLLHTMYVDKPLHGLNAVQTLSRLNRTHLAKKECFVLDFRNDAEGITESFAPFYEHAVAIPTDPNLMYDARTALQLADVIRNDDVDVFAVAFISTARDAHEKTEAALNPAVDRFVALDDEQQDAFKETLDTFLRLYSFLSQVVTFTDISMEKLYVYGRALQLKIRSEAGERLDISDKVQLTHLKTEVTWEGDAGVDKPDHEQEQFWGSHQMSEDAAEALSKIVAEMNERFGDGLAEEDRLVIDQYESAFLNHDEVVSAALANDNIDDFIKVVFAPVFLDTVITQMNANEKVFKLILADDKMRVLFRDYIAQKVYDQIRQPTP